MRSKVRQDRALELRIAGASSPRIAAVLGISRSQVWRLLSGALADRQDEIGEKTELLRAIEAERIEGYIAQLRPLALAGDLAAHRALLRWHERLARLLALDLDREVEEGQEPVVIRIEMRLPGDRGEPPEPPDVIEDAQFEEITPAEIEAGEADALPDDGSGDDGRDAEGDS